MLSRYFGGSFGVPLFGIVIAYSAFICVVVVVVVVAAAAVVIVVVVPLLLLLKLVFKIASLHT
jgi:hypothetical protein